MYFHFSELNVHLTFYNQRTTPVRKKDEDHSHRHHKPGAWPSVKSVTLAAKSPTQSNIMCQTDLSTPITDKVHVHANLPMQWSDLVF